jgi:hypothetical protein
VHDRAFDQVVGGVRQRDDVRAGLGASLREELVSEGARSRLHRAPRQLRSSASVHQLDPKIRAKPAHLKCHLVRPGAQIVVEVGGGDIETELVHGEQQGRRIRPARHGDEDAIALADQARVAYALN